MQEHRVMTEAEMALAKATGSRVVTIAKEQTPDEFFAKLEIEGLRTQLQQLSSTLNTSHTLALGWTLEDDLRVAKHFVELRRGELYKIELVLDRLGRQVADLGIDLDRL